MNISAALLCLDCDDLFEVPFRGDNETSEVEGYCPHCASRSYVPLNIFQEGAFTSMTRSFWENIKEEYHAKKTSVAIQKELQKLPNNINAIYCIDNNDSKLSSESNDKFDINTSTSNSSTDQNESPESEISEGDHSGRKRLELKGEIEQGRDWLNADYA